MIRLAAAFMLAVTMSPGLLRAQDYVFTVTAASADVYKGPSNVTPVVGHVARGTVMPVLRNLGSWVRVPWPAAPDGIGYVHVTTGRFGSRAEAPTSNGTPRSSAAPVAPATSALPMTRATTNPPVAAASQHTNAVGHLFGVGGRVGSMSSVGATARAWRHNRFGIQVGVSRDAMTSDLAAGRVTAVQFEPGVLYALFDHVSDYVWVRPYAGSMVSFRRQTWKSDVTGDSHLSDSGVGFRVLGGCEIMFAAVPRLGLSAELGYGRYPMRFTGFKPDALTMSIGGHWYIR